MLCMCEPKSSSVVKNDSIKLLVFDGLTENFSTPEIEEYDDSYGIITLKVKGNFVLSAFLIMEE